MDCAINDTTAVILVGGLGTRLRPVIESAPKVLAPVNGRPFLFYLLDQLDEIGIRHAILCVGYLGDQVEECLGSRYNNISLTYSYEQEPLGTAGALRSCLHLFHSPSALVLNGDSYCNTDFGSLWEFHEEVSAKATLLLAEVPDTARFGRVKCDNTGAVVEFREKSIIHAGPGWINAGVYLLQKEFIATIPLLRMSLERDVFPYWIGRGLYACRRRATFIDIGTPESYATAEQFFAGIQL